MPPFGAMMSDDQVAAVVNYLRTHFGNHYRDAVTAEDVKIRFGRIDGERGVALPATGYLSESASMTVVGEQYGRTIQCRGLLRGLCRAIVLSLRWCSMRPGIAGG